MSSSRPRTLSDAQDDLNMMEAHLRASAYMFFIHPFVELKAKLNRLSGRA